MRYRTTMAAVATAAVLATGIGFAQRPVGGMRQGVGGPPAQGMRRPAGGGMEKLNLTQEQRQQLQPLMEAHREANRERAEKLRDLQKQLQEAIFLGQGDVQSLVAQITELQAQMFQARVAHQQELAKILTAEQRAQMAKMPPAGPGPMGRGGRRGPRN